MFAVFLCSLSIILLASVEARGAGRAFPIDSENYVIERFTNINSKLEWDPTNFLVDLAGYYANCDAAGTSAQEVAVDKQTPAGASISGIVDSIDGSRADVEAVNGYIKSIVGGWIQRGTFDYLILGADRFGCSVRPGCRRSVVVSCLFSPGSGDVDQGDKPENIEFDVQAQAFTPEQYKVAEQFTGNKWDRSHFLENLSGVETKCAMIGDDNWPFTDLRKIEAKYGIRLTPVYGSSPNHGSTQGALDRILPSFKEVQNAKDVGCSLIPDCIFRSQMYVVVTCLYIDN